MFRRLKKELRIHLHNRKASLMLLNLTSHMEGRPRAPQLSGSC